MRSSVRVLTAVCLVAVGYILGTCQLHRVAFAQPEETASDEPGPDVAHQEQIVVLEGAAERQHQHQAPQVACGRQAVEAGVNLRRKLRGHGRMGTRLRLHVLLLQHCRAAGDRPPQDGRSARVDPLREYPAMRGTLCDLTEHRDRADSGSE